MAMPAPAIRSRSSSAAAIAALPGTGVPPRAPLAAPPPLGHAPSILATPTRWCRAQRRLRPPALCRAALPGGDGQTDPRAMLTHSNSL